MELDGFELTVANSDWELSRLVNAIGMLGVMLGVEVLPPPPSDMGVRIPLSYRSPTGREEDIDGSMSASRYLVKWKPCSDYEPDENAETDTNWMEMDIQTPYLRTPKWAKGAGCSDTGSVFRAPHRLLTDQRVFRMNRAKRQGSLLVDTSGSMGLSRESIQNIVKSVPAAVIGTYGGYEHATGGLRVVAKGGRLVTEDKEYLPVGEMNGVDGPALRWLGAQPLPRIWISDGQVTGEGDHQTEGLAQIAAGICERYRIQRVNTLQAALRRL